MKAYPIIFSSEMVRAILAGNKTQTRRVIKPQPHKLITDFIDLGDSWKPVWGIREFKGNIGGTDHAEAAQEFHEAVDQYGSPCIKCPYGVPGSKLWVRETAWYGPQERRVEYDADFDDDARDAARFCKAIKRLSIHMPRWASRINLINKRVRVERVQEITPEDARTEGDKERSGMPEFHARGPLCHVDWFRNLWNSINAKPKPKRRGGVITHYESFPWDESSRDPRTEIAGKPHYCFPNPQVWVIEFEPAQRPGGR